MSKISQDAARAFENSQPFKRGNTVVQPRLTSSGLAWEMLLHGNRIAYMTPREPLSITAVICITTAGWPTQTTKSRLNAIHGIEVTTVKGQLMLNGVPWDGQFTRAVAIAKIIG